jgi:hypothetical protein
MRAQKNHGGPGELWRGALIAGGVRGAGSIFGSRNSARVNRAKAAALGRIGHVHATRLLCCPLPSVCSAAVPSRLVIGVFARKARRYRSENARAVGNKDA